MKYIEFLIANPLYLLVLLAVVLSVVFSMSIINHYKKRGIRIIGSSAKTLGALTMSAILAVIFVPLVMYDNFLNHKQRDTRLIAATELNEKRYNAAKLSETHQNDACVYASVLAHIHGKVSDTVNARKWDDAANVECTGRQVLSAAAKKFDKRYHEAKSAGKNQMEVCITAGALADTHRKAGNAEDASKWGQIANDECTKDAR